MSVKLYKSKRIDDSEFNGGYEDCAAEIISGQYENLFPDVSPSERTSGITRYRKFFVHATAQTISSTYVGIFDRSPAGDYFRLHASSAAQTQGGLLTLGSHKWYGTARITVAAAAGSTVVTCEFDGDVPDIEPDDRVLIADNIKNELHTAVNMTSTGLSVTVTLLNALNNDYLPGARLCHLLPLSGIEPSYSDWSETSSSGTYDESNYPPTLYLEGTVEDTWTLTFYSASAFTCVGLTSGLVGTGDISSDFSPANPVGGTYFTILASGWGGTWQSGETITFKTHPASKPAWAKEVVPAGAGSCFSNEVPLIIIYA